VNKTNLDQVLDWLYEDGKIPTSIQPEEKFFDVIIKATEGEDPCEIVQDLKCVKLDSNVLQRFMDYFIAKAIRENKLRQILFAED
jgi:hypothetical protein